MLLYVQPESLELVPRHKYHPNENETVFLTCKIVTGISLCGVKV